MGSAKLSFKDTVIIFALLPVLFLVALVVLALLPILIPYTYFYKLYLRIRFERRWCSAGRRALLVYSRSPNWQPYIEDRWLAEIGDKVVTLNWSDRALPTWRKSLEASIFKRWAPSKDFNPMAVLFPRTGKPRILQFRKAFLARKHGKASALEQLEAELFTFLQDDS